MISSLVWLYLLQIGRINPDSAPWLIYLPICFVELVGYWLLLPKVCDWLDKVKE